jgi:hypothetical protein
MIEEDKDEEFFEDNKDFDYAMIKFLRQYRDSKNHFLNEVFKSLKEEFLMKNISEPPTDPNTGRKRFYIPIGCGHPNRDTVISTDEITDLKIELALCNNIDDIIRRI